MVDSAAPPPFASDLRDHVRAHAENRPGVYRLLGPEGQVLYVGKSIRVRSRLLSYFRADRSEKAAEIVAFARQVEWDHLPSEFSALLREFRLIRRLRPPFNVQHKKERAVCFLRIPKEPAPRILVTTMPVEDGSEYFGPVLGAERARAAVRALVDVLGLRTCPASTPLRLADQGDLFGSAPIALCARAELRRCIAPCAAGCTERGYARRLDVARRFLRGETDELRERLRERLRQASERWIYEYAAVVKERIELLTGLREALVRMVRSLDALTALYHVKGHDGEDRLYLLRRGLVQSELPAPRDAHERAGVRSRAERVLAGPPPPVGRVGPDAIAEMLLVERWFRRNPGERAALRPL
ncbi:MAG: nuclease [Gemmatimonadetes bacterium]|nr:nuclease [Gemmatimonadota bacterium]